MDTATVVVGGGVVGSAAAWALARRGVEVLLLEQYGPGHRLGSSHGSARIFRLAYAEPEYVALARAALPRWRELEATTGRRLLELTGGVDHGDADVLAALRRALAAAGEPAELVDAAEVARRWPGLRVDGAALVQPTAGRLHADDAVRGFQEAARSAGAEVRHGVPVQAVEVAGDAVRVHLGAGALTARHAVVAAGGWAAALLGGILPLPRLRVTEEQPVHFAPAEPGQSWPSFIHHRPGPAVYGLGSVDGVKVGFHGAGREVDPARRAAGAVDEASLRAMRDYARRWLPGVDAERAEPSPCLYTLTDDHDFVVDRRGPLTVAAGFSGHGFKFAPAVGELLADLVAGVRPAPDRFALDRPRRPGPMR
jgi:sarcosine oxidase